MDANDTDTKRALSWIVKRLSYIARQGTNRDTTALLKKEYIFKLFAAIAMKVGSELAEPLLVPMLHPLYRVSVSKPRSSKSSWRERKRAATAKLPLSATEITHESLISTAKEVLDFLERIAGNSNFVKAYAAVKAHVDGLREKRKRERAVERAIGKRPKTV